MTDTNLLPLRITLKCPLDCSFCISHDPEGEHLRTKKIMALIKKIFVADNNTILIHGGDPLLHPDILRIAQEASKHGTVVLMSPGINLTTENTMRLMPYIERFRVVIPALNPVLYTKLTGKNDIAGMFAGLKAALDLNAPVEVEIPVLTDNLAHLPDMITSLASGVPGLKGLFLTFRNPDGLYNEREKLWQFLTYLSKTRLPWPATLDRHTLPPPCTAPSESVFLQTEGLFDVVMKRPANSKVREKCQDCAIKNFCPANNQDSIWAGLDPSPISWGADHNTISCTIPWTNLDIGEGDGHAAACCRDWVKIEGASVFHTGINGA